MAQRRRPHRLEGVTNGLCRSRSRSLQDTLDRGPPPDMARSMCAGVRLRRLPSNIRQKAPFATSELRRMGVCMGTCTVILGAVVQQYHRSWRVYICDTASYCARSQPPVAVRLPHLPSSCPTRSASADAIERLDPRHPVDAELGRSRSRSSGRLARWTAVVFAVVLAAATVSVSIGPVSAADNPYQRGPDPTRSSVAASQGTFATAQVNVPAVSSCWPVRTAPRSRRPMWMVSTARSPRRRRRDRQHGRGDVDQPRRVQPGLDLQSLTAPGCGPS